MRAILSATGVFTPPYAISNAELVESFNQYVDLFNHQNAQAIRQGQIEAKAYSSEEFIVKASGIHSRYVMDKQGILNPKIMRPLFPQRSNNEPSMMAQMALMAIEDAFQNQGLRGKDIDLVIVAASNLERAYPALAIEIQALIGARGFAFDMNVACSSASFAITLANDLIKQGSVRRVLIVNPEICSAHLEWRDRDCHFIFGDVATAILIEAEDIAKAGFFIESARTYTEFSNNIRNNSGFLRRTRPEADADLRDMLFMQNGRKVFKELLPIVVRHIEGHLDDVKVEGSDLKRIWLHQANQTMNDFAGKKIFGRTPSSEEQPNILKDYANTSSAGSVVAFSQHCQDFQSGEQGLLASFGAGYSVGSVILTKC